MAQFDCNPSFARCLFPGDLTIKSVLLLTVLLLTSACGNQQEDFGIQEKSATPSGLVVSKSSLYFTASQNAALPEAQYIDISWEDPGIDSFIIGYCCSWHIPDEWLEYDYYFDVPNTKTKTIRLAIKTTNLPKGYYIGNYSLGPKSSSGYNQYYGDLDIPVIFEIK